MSPPRQLWRVEFIQGFGMPDVYKREHSRRTYENADDAARMVATVRRWPSHHELLGVWRTETAWARVDPDMLPVYEGDPLEDEDGG